MSRRIHQRTRRRRDDPEPQGIAHDGSRHRLEIAKALGLGTMATGTPAQATRADASLLAPSGDFPSLDAVVASHIRLALERAGGRIEGARGAAALLGVNPHTLRARMRRLRIEWGRYRRPSGRA